MNMLATDSTLAPRSRASNRLPGAEPAEEIDLLRAHKLDLSDYLLLTGIVLVPFVAPIPGPTDATPSGWTERVTLCDGFLAMAMLLAAWQRCRYELGAWINRRPRGFSPLPAVGPAPWLLPTRSPIWYFTGALLAVMALSWFVNPLMRINAHMAVALLVQLYLAAVAVLVASAVQRYRSPQPILVAWVLGLALLAVICTYDSIALITKRPMIYPGVEGRLRGPFRTSSQLAGYSLSSFFILLATSRFLSQNRWIRRASVLACITPLFIVLASRRSAVASLTAGYIALLVVSKNRIRVLFSTAVPAVVLLMGLFVFGSKDLQQYMIERVKPLIGQDEGRVNIAVDHFSRGVAAFKEHPVLGLGFGAFSDTRYGELTETISHEQHSGYIAILAETGAVGFTIMILLHLAVFGQLVQLWRHSSGRYRELALNLMAVLAALGVSEIYNRIWRERAMWIIAGMIAALPLVANQERIARARQAVVTHGVNRIRRLTSRIT